MKFLVCLLNLVLSSRLILARNRLNSNPVESISSPITAKEEASCTAGKVKEE